MNGAAGRRLISRFRIELTLYEASLRSAAMRSTASWSGSSIAPDAPARLCSFASNARPPSGRREAASDQYSTGVKASIVASRSTTRRRAIYLHDKVSFAELGRLADLHRFRQVPGNVATFVIDRNISLTNMCVTDCHFCAFFVEPGSPRAFTLSVDEVLDRVKEATDNGATQILIQGGLNPDLDLAYYEKVFRAIKSKYDVWLHSLTATEIIYLSKKGGFTIKETLARLIDAGLDSLPGGGAEILVDSVRKQVSPKKMSTEKWFDVMRTAHSMNLKTTATMVYGFGETTAQRVEHLTRIRDLQDETGGFTAFIPWSFQPNRTRIKREGSTGIDYLRMVALARLVLDNVPHIQGGL